MCSPTCSIHQSTSAEEKGPNISTARSLFLSFCAAVELECAYSHKERLRLCGGEGEQSLAVRSYPFVVVARILCRVERAPRVATPCSPRRARGARRVLLTLIVVRLIPARWVIVRWQARVIYFAGSADEPPGLQEILRHRGPVWPNLSEMGLKVPGLGSIGSATRQEGIP